jgi:amidohydrolase
MTPITRTIGAVVAVFSLSTLSPRSPVGLHTRSVYAGADAFDIKVQGQGAHGAAPWKGVDAAAVAGQILQSLQLVVSRQTDIWSPVVLTVGTLQGGVRRNALASEVTLAGTLRTYSSESRRKSRESMGRIVDHVPQAFAAKATLVFSDETPPVVNDPALVALLRPALESEVGAANLKILEPMSYADDFSFMSEKVPSLYFQLGIRSEQKGITAGTHTETFDVDEDSIALGARLLSSLAIKNLNEK